MCTLGWGSSKAPRRVRISALSRKLYTNRKLPIHRFFFFISFSFFVVGPLVKKNTRMLNLTLHPGSFWCYYYYLEVSYNIKKKILFVKSFINTQFDWYIDIDQSILILKLFFNQPLLLLLLRSFAQSHKLLICWNVFILSQVSALFPKFYDLRVKPCQLRFSFIWFFFHQTLLKLIDIPGV